MPRKCKGKDEPERTKKTADSIAYVGMVREARFRLKVGVTAKQCECASCVALWRGEILLGLIHLLMASVTSDDPNGSPEPLRQVYDTVIRMFEENVGINMDAYLRGILEKT